ncbi:MAG: MFS transporter [Anaerolineaceae bacterium]|nr:MFS transporter [Anaerolineaceae bacterium]
MQNILHIRGLHVVARFPFFYGWVVLVAATLGLILPFFGHNTTIGLFVDDFIVEFGMDRTTLSGLFGLGGFVAALGLPWVGKVTDRYGSRRIGAIAGAIFALSLIALSTATNPLALLLMFVIMRAVGLGPLWIANSTVLAQWFRSRRGRVFSITVVVTWLFQGFYVPFVQQLLETMSWRQVWQLLGLLVGVVVVPLVWLLLRDRPESYGLLPDGRVNHEETKAPEPEQSWTLPEARRTAIFRIFVLGRTLTPAAGSALILHQVSIFNNLGYDAALAAQSFGMIAVVAGGLSLFGGVLVDRLRPNHLMVIQICTSLAVLVLSATMTTPLLLLLYILAFGSNITLGSLFDNTVWANLFGREHLGEIRGFIAILMSAGVAIGPVLFGWSFDTFGDYNVMVVVFIVLLLAQMVIAWMAPMPRRETQDGSASTTTLQPASV